MRARLRRLQAPPIAALGAASFDPASLSSHLWLDPSDLSTLFQDSAGTTPVTADSDPVGKISDKGSSASHFTQGTAGARPLYKTSSGLHWLLFDGVDDYMQSVNAATDFMTTTVYDIVCAGIINTIATDTEDPYDNDSFWATLTDGTTGLTFRTTVASGMNAYNYDGNHDIAADEYTAANAFVAHIRHDGGNLSLTQNARTTVTGASGTTLLFNDPLLLASKYNLAGTGGFADMRFHGLIARKTIFDATELAAIKTWMGAKVGIVL